MESGPGCQGAGHSCGLQLYPSWSRPTRYLQGALLFIILFTTHFQRVVSERNETITAFDDANPWNETTIKAQGGCLDFHPANETSYFYYWPEDNPHFKHCCGTPPQNYTYGIYGPWLGYATYYDLGRIDRCLPYWQCFNLFRQMFKTKIWNIQCEFTDLQGLYKRRFFYDTVLNRGLLQSAIPVIVSMETLVVLSVALYWFLWRRRANAWTGILKSATRSFLRNVRTILVMDWIHLCLLAIIGNGLIEAVGRQDPYASISKSFYNYALLYVILTILVWYSCVLRQLCYWIAEIDCECRKKSPEVNQAVRSPEDSRSAAPRNTTTTTTTTTRAGSLSPLVTELEKKIGLNADWKWQPIAAQAGILFCLGGFLTYIDEGTLSAALFGLVVQAACPWSGLYASKVIIHAFPFLLRTLRGNLFKARAVDPMPRRNYRGLWRSLVHLKQWPRSHRRRAGNSLAQPDDSAVMLELAESEPVRSGEGTLESI